LEVEVAGQGETVEKPRANLTEALDLGGAFEDPAMEEAIASQTGARYPPISGRVHRG